MFGNIELEVLSPEKIVLVIQAKMVTLPGTIGYFSVLAGHIPLISTLKPGSLIVYDEDQLIIEHLFLTEGFVEVNQVRCLVLVQGVIPVAKLEKKAIQQGITNLNEDLEDAKDDTERNALRQNLAIEEAKLQVIKDTLQSPPIQSKIITSA